MNNGLLYALTVLIWGSTFFAIEFQLGVVAPEVSIFYRFASASALLFGWSASRGLKLRFAAREHLRFATLGILLFGINYVLTYNSQQYIVSALAAIAFATLPWLNMLNGRLLFGTRTTPRVVLGAVVGVVGITTVFSPQISDFSFDDATFYGFALALLAALSASFGNMASQSAQRAELPILQSNAWGMLYGALCVGCIAAFSGEAFTFDLSAGYVISLAYLTVFGSIVAFGAYLTLLGRIGADKAGYATVVFPVIAVALSALFEGLAIDATTATGFALVLVGNVLVLGGNKKRTDAVASMPSSKPLLP
ncbi:MAG: EamA family transporter [Pseudomonadota bacterium]